MIEKGLKKDFIVPELTGEPDWVEIEIPDNFGFGRQFITGDSRTDRIRLRYFKRPSDNAFMARIWFGPAAEGPVGHVHGGSMASVLDEAMGIAAWIAGHIVVTVKLTVNYRKMLPLGSVTTLEAKIKAVNGRKVTTTGRIFNDKGETISKGEGFFIKLPPGEAEKININIKA